MDKRDIGILIHSRSFQALNFSTRMVDKLVLGRLNATILMKKQKGAVTMSLSKFGAKVREYRRAYGVTLSTMASTLGASTAFLSAMETGRSKIPMDWVEKIAIYFNELGEQINVQELKAIACDDNESVSLEGLRPQHRMLIAGFANSDLNQEQLTRLGRLLGEIYGENSDDHSK